MFIMEVGGDYGPAKLKVKFGKGWMGRSAEIYVLLTKTEVTQM